MQGVGIFMEITVQVGECIVRKGIRANEKKTKPETSKLLVLKHHLQVINIQLGDDNTPVQAGLPSFPTSAKRALLGESHIWNLGKFNGLGSWGKTSFGKQPAF